MCLTVTFWWSNLFLVSTASKPSGSFSQQLNTFLTELPFWQNDNFSISCLSLFCYDPSDDCSHLRGGSIVKIPVLSRTAAEIHACMFHHFKSPEIYALLKLLHVFVYAFVVFPASVGLYPRIVHEYHRVELDLLSISSDVSIIISPLPSQLLIVIVCMYVASFCVFSACLVRKSAKAAGFYWYGPIWISNMRIKTSFWNYSVPNSDLDWP
jgi:hypothetical protein